MQLIVIYLLVLLFYKYCFINIVLKTIKLLAGSGSMNRTLVKYGFITAALMNIGGVLVFSRFFTNGVINSADPVVMSNFGLVMIMVWGLAYLGAAKIVAKGNVNIGFLAGAFAVEKLVYVVVWVKWLAANSLGQLYDADLFAGVFYSIYGINDLLFMLFFAWVCVKQRGAGQGIPNQA